MAFCLMFVCFHKAPIWIDDKIQASHLELNHACSAQNVNKKISPLKKLFAYVEKFNNGDPQERVFKLVRLYITINMNTRPSDCGFSWFQIEKY